MISPDDARDQLAAVPALDDPSALYETLDAPADANRRAACLQLARKVAPPAATIYDLVAIADWLDRGPDAIHGDDSAEWEPEECSCNDPEATHPLGDPAFCSVSP